MSGSREILLSDYLVLCYAARRIGLRDSSLIQIAATIQVFSRWLGRPAYLADLTQDNLLAFLRAYYAGGRSAATVNKKRTVLLALWRDAIETGCRDDPPPKIPRIAEHHALPEAWSIAEISRVVTCAGREPGFLAGLPAGLFWRSLLLAIYDTGGRIGAILAVRQADVRLDGPSPGIELRSLQSKTRRAQWCPLHPQTIEACRAIWSPERHLMWPWPMEARALRERFARILSDAGVRHGKGRGGVFHKLRRTSGTLIEANGGDGARHLGNTRAVFDAYYRDPRICGPGQLTWLPRPEID